jgi:hypothetical protein
MRNLGILTAALAFGLMGAMDARAETVAVNVVQVRASNEGGESVDAALGSLGERLKRQYPYRNYKRLGAESLSGAAGSELRFAVADHVLVVRVESVADNQVTLRVSVARGRDTVVNTSMNVGAGRTFLIAVPLGADKLILAITPTVTR